MRITLDTQLKTIMTNKRRAGALSALGVKTVSDALTYYPFRIAPAVAITPISAIRLGIKAAFAARVTSFYASPMARGGKRAVVTVSDRGLDGVRRSTSASLVFFSRKDSYIEWLRTRLEPGTSVVVCGDPSDYNGTLQFTHPHVLVVADYFSGDIPMSGTHKADAPDFATALERVAAPMPVYHANSRISSEHIHETIVGLLRTLAFTQAGHGSETASASGVSTTRSASRIATDPQTGEPTLAPPRHEAIDWRALTGIIPDIIPEPLRRKHGYMHRAEAFCAVHDPGNADDPVRGLATLRYEEALVSQTSMLAERAQAGAARAFPCTGVNATGGNVEEQFIASLPFTLTRGQRKVIDQIDTDMSRPAPMRRLLQGEVGSGKTVVALAAMLRAVGSGRQAVLVAPTQVLAEQHYATIGRMMSAVSGGVAVPVVLLTGGMKLKERRRVLGIAASGQACIVVATHAAFSDSFQAPELALVVIDEQHRFGVEQRGTLLEDNGNGVEPHLLVMTATPIPRTAAMTWFGNLDISWLTELPGGRKPIMSVVVSEDDNRTMAAMFVHVRRHLDAGERAYVVCARIDEDDPASFDEGYEAADIAPEADLDGDGTPDGGQSIQPLHSVAQMCERLRALPQFRGIEFATLTGRDDDETKRNVMEKFSSGEVQVLVATTVIEVGVDVSQASNIIIFDAEHYGLSQLHQLRGRVGRGGTESWAFFVTRAQSGSLGAKRLAVIRDSTDGAQIARADLMLRGAGDVLGDAQSGRHSSLKLLRVVDDADVIEQARGEAREILESDPNLTNNVELAQAVVIFNTQAEATSA